VVRVVESQREGMLSSIWLLDSDGIHMRAVAAPTFRRRNVQLLCCWLCCYLAVEMQSGQLVLDL